MNDDAHADAPAPSRERARARPAPAWRRALGALALAATVCGLLATAAGLAARAHWALELFVHFRAQGALGLGLCAAAALGAGRPRVALAALGGALLHTALLLPWYFPRASAPAPASADAAPRLTVLFCNVLTENPRRAPLAARVRARDADVFAAVETDASWLRDLAGATARYPHRLEHPREDHFGLALYSRYPLRDARVVHLVPGAPPALVATIEAPGRPLALAVLHTTPPLGRAWAALRDALASAARAQVLARGGDALVVGDFNAAPWAPALAGYEAAGFTEARRGRGVLPSWSPGVSLLAVPIDLAWLRGARRFTALEREPDVGSDHRPVFLELR